jgi:Tol biopolymer transport system component
MPLRVGETLGAYEITGTLGEGGMGEVYRARDSRVKRDVALKTSNTAFTDRFQREAEAIAALSHPNVCTLFDVGPNYLVMELVEGPTLAEVLAKGRLPVPEALRIATQIADALEAAHARHVVHRDLKPGNVKVRPDGLVKVLDFGLAKMGDPASGASAADPDDSPTLSGPMTSAGMILGTAGYMAPEQARGDAVDHRADVWAFGVILYEMLSGARLYRGATVSDTLAAVLLTEPDWSRVPATELSSLGRLLRWCLEKDPKKRLSDIAMAKRLLVEDPAPAAAVPQPTRAASRLWPALAAAFAILLAAVAAYAFWFTPTPPAPDTTAFTITAPQGALLNGDVAVSPNGRQLAFVVRDANSRNSLWLRNLDSVEVRILASADENQVEGPFWSPDGQWVGYSADGQLKRVPAAGGTPHVICSYEGDLRGASWGDDGTIVFANFYQGTALWKVAAEGGTPVRMKSSPELNLRNPAFLPGSTRFLWGSGGEGLAGSVFVGSLDTPAEQWPTAPVLTTASQAVYLPPGGSSRSTGVLLFSDAGTLMVQPFDAASLTVSGQPVRAVSGISSYARTSAADFAVSPAGTLVYRTGGQQSARLAWVGRTGTEIGPVGEGEVYSELDLSPDGRRLAAVRGGDIWVIDIDRSTTLRLTTTPAQERAPLWASDGASIVFASDRGGRLNLYEKAVDSAAPERELLTTPDNKIPTSISPDGKWLLFTQSTSRGFDVYLLAMGTGTREVKPLLNGPAAEGQAVVSPDGRWVAYTSAESGRIQVYLRSFPDGGTPRKVAEQLGAEPRWSSNGELFFRGNYATGRTSLFSVALGKDGALGKPTELFTAGIVGAGGFDRGPNYLISPDGQRILAVTRKADEPDTPLTVVVNWKAPAASR